MGSEMAGKGKAKHLDLGKAEEEGRGAGRFKRKP